MEKKEKAAIRKLLEIIFDLDEEGCLDAIVALVRIRERRRKEVDNTGN